MIPQDHILILWEIIVSTDTIFTFPKEIKVHEKPFVALLWACYNFHTLGMVVKGQEVRGAAETTIPLRERHAQSTPIETQHLWHPRQGFHFKVNAVFLEKDDRKCWGLGFLKKKNFCTAYILLQRFTKR